MKSPVGWPPRVSTLPSLHVARMSSVRPSALSKTRGGQATAFELDVSNAGAVQQLIDAVERDPGPVDLLVNNAAVIPPLGPVWEVAPEDWWRLMEINLFGTFLCSRAVLAGMTRRGSGRIVNVASGAGIESPPFLPPMSLVKRQ